MTRPLAVVVLLALPLVACAQNSAPIPLGPPMIGGREVIGPPISNGASALFPVWTDVPSRFSVGGGSLSGPPPVLVPSGEWGGVTYPRPIYPVLVPPGTETKPAPVVRSATVNLSGEARATLAVQFPAASEVWVNQKKIDGKPSAEWTLTSPVLKMGEAHTFELKSRWTVDGKTFEASRSVAVTSGDRSRLIVVSGTVAKE